MLTSSLSSFQTVSKTDDDLYDLLCGKTVELHSHERRRV